MPVVGTLAGSATQSGFVPLADSRAVLGFVTYWVLNLKQPVAASATLHVAGIAPVAAPVRVRVAIVLVASHPSEAVRLALDEPMTKPWGMSDPKTVAWVALSMVPVPQPAATPTRMRLLPPPLPLRRQ